MLTQIINGKIFTPQGWLDEGSVLIRDNKILEVTNCDLYFPNFVFFSFFRNP